jgi:hypothetical protein
MIDTLVTLAAAALALATALVVISRLIPDRYDRPQTSQHAQASD